MRKPLSLFLSSLVLLPLLIGCGPTNDKHKTFTAKMSVPEIGNYELHGDFDFDISSFVNKQPSQFDINIAKLAFISNCPGLRIDGKGEPASDILPSLGQLGFTSLERVELSSDDYDEDPNDLTLFEMGSYPFNYSNEAYQLFLIRFRGTETLEDNLSNFDIGINNKNYMIKDGIHEQWRNKSNHKGYDVTANRSIDKFDDYVTRTIAPNAKPIYLITGHSRGAAIANIVAKVITDRNEKTFAYTFASPTVTEDEDAEQYTNIFNFINTDDIVPYLPPEELGLGLYGEKKAVSIVQNISIWNKFFPTIPFKHMDVNTIKQLMMEVFKSREFAYAIPEGDERSVLVEFLTKVKADAANETYKNIFEPDTLAAKHTYVGEVEEIEGGGYGFIVKASPIFIFDVVNTFFDDPARVIENISEIIDFVRPTFRIIIPSLPSILNKELPTQFLTAHLIENYYPVVEYFK